MHSGKIILLALLVLGLSNALANAAPDSPGGMNADNTPAPTTPGPSPTDSSNVKPWNGSTSPDTNFACMTKDHKKGRKTAAGGCEPVLNSPDENAYPPSDVNSGQATPSTQQPQ